MSLVRKLAVVLLPVAALAAAAACTTSPGATGGAPARTAPPDPTLPTPTPRPIPMSRTNPNIVEETETYYIERLPKAEYIKLDDRHIRNPIITGVVEIFREDENYYYVYNKKFVPELDARPTPRPGEATSVSAEPTPVRPRMHGEAPYDPKAPTAADFEDLSPPRVTGRVRLQSVASSGLPDQGLWRASFVLADMNEDGRLDVVAPPSRLGPEPKLHIWLGKGDGSFERWKLQFVSSTGADPSLDYGGVAVGDIDGDGHMDVAAASHGGGPSTFFGDGKGTFRADRRGLPDGFSAQAVALLDSDGDGKLDLVVSRDLIDTKEGAEVDVRQIRLYLYRAAEGWVHQPDALTGGFYSNSLHAWDADGDGRKDILTGSHYQGALTLLWKGVKGAFVPVAVEPLEVYAYHFATEPGTFGSARHAAFADGYYMYDPGPTPARRATGISVYERTPDGWARHRVWRKKDGGSMQYGLALGDLDGDGLDDVLFPDSEVDRLRVFFQEKDGSFREMAESDEPALSSPGQCVRLGDLDGDGRLDIVLSRTAISSRPEEIGGFDVYLNRPARP